MISDNENVNLIFMEYDEELEYSLVGTNEANPMLGRISDRSPIGSAMIGATVGDIIKVNTPNGEMKLKILAVSRTKNNA